MDTEKKQSLESAGYTVGSTDDFLNLTEIKTLKLGKMNLSIESLKEIHANSQLKHVMGNFIILNAITNWETEIVEYVSVSDFFLPIKDTDDMPLYTLNISTNTNEAGEKIYSFNVEKV